MGGSFSSTDPKIRGKLIKRTQEDRDLMSDILQFMLTQSSLIDFYSIADPERCKNYLVAGRDALLSLFRSIDIYPDKKDGVLYFQRIDGLKKGLRVEDLNKQNQYCTELATFYIRIFQIFGALILSALDVNIPTTDVEVHSKRQQRVDDIFISKLPFHQQGGVLSNKWAITYPNYDILNMYLMPPQVGRPQNQLKFANYDSLYIDFNTMYSGTADNLQLLPEGSFAPNAYYTFFGGNEPEPRLHEVYGRLILSRNGNDLKLIMTDFAGTVGTSMENKKALQLNATLKLDPSGKFSRNGKDLPSTIKEMLEAVAPKPKFSVVEFLKDLRYISDTIMNSGSQKIVGTNIFITANQDKTNVPIRYIDTIQIDKDSQRVTIDNCILTITPDMSNEMLFNKFKVRLAFNNKRVIPPTLEDKFKFPDNYKEGIFQRENENSTPLHITTGQTIPNYLEAIFKNIVERRSVEEIAKFERTREGYVKPYDSDAIPKHLRVKKLWDSLTQDPPVKAYCTARAMQLLSPSALEKHVGNVAYSSVCRTTYYLQNNGSIPKDGGNPDTIYGIRALSSLFLDTIDNTSINHENLDKLKALIKQPLPEICKGVTDAQIPITGSGVVDSLRGKANQLIQRQIEHTANVMKIIQKLFYVKKGSPVVFQPNVKKGGMNYVNQISNEARNLLLDYYGDCEGLYNEGVQILNNSLTKPLDK